MKKSLLAILIIAFSSQLFAQIEFAPLGSNWKVRGWTSPNTFWENSCEYTTCIGNFKQLISYDTLTIDNKECKLLKFLRGTDKENMIIKEDSIIVHQDGQRIFFYKENDFHLMLDFGLEVGDTLHFKAPNNYINYSLSDYFHAQNDYNSIIGGKAIVESISNIELQGQIRRMFEYRSFLNDELQDSVIIYRSIEGIGNIHGFFGEAPSIIADGCHGTLLCYQDSSIIYSRYENCECIFQDQLTSTSNIEDDSFDIYPNPVHDRLYIESDIAITSIEIINTSGKLVITEKYNTGIDLSTLTSGVYFLVFYVKGQRYIKKIFKT